MSITIVLVEVSGKHNNYDNKKIFFKFSYNYYFF